MATVTLYPNAAGQYTNVPTLFGAATQWQACLSDDNDTSYIANATSTAQISIFNLDACGIGAGNIITNVTVYAKVRNTQNIVAGTAGISVRDGTTDATDAGVQTTTTYALISKSMNTRPAGGAWTIAAVDALQAGVQLIRPANKYDTRCTLVYAVVTYVPPPQPPTNLASPSQTDTTIDLTWTTGANSDRTLIRFKEVSYPASITDGTQAYFGTGESVMVGGTVSIIQDSYDAGWSMYTGGSTRSGERINSFPAFTITQVSFYLYKYGSPTGTAYIRIRKVSDDSILGTIGSIDVSTLTTSPVRYDYAGSVNNPSAQDLRFTVEYDGGSTINKILVGYRSVDVLADAVLTTYEASWTDWGSSEAAIRVYYESYPALEPSTTYYFRAWGYSTALDVYSSATADLTQATSAGVIIPRHGFVNFQDPGIV